MQLQVTNHTKVQCDPRSAAGTRHMARACWALFSPPKAIGHASNRLLVTDKATVIDLCMSFVVSKQGQRAVVWLGCAGRAQTMPFQQEQCCVEQRGADGNTSSKPAARSHPCCACPGVCLISVNSCQPIVSLEYHGKHIY